MSYIGIDYDDTYTADPEMWSEIMRLMSARGHIPLIVTFRDESLPGHRIDDIRHEVFYTAGVPKAEYMLRQGIEIDIWCDDWPELIGETR